ETILDLQASGRLDLRDLVEEIIPVEEAARAYDRLAGSPRDHPIGALLLSYAGEPRPSRLDARTLDVRVPRARTHPATRSSRVRIGLIGPGSFASRVLVPAFVLAGAQLEIVGGGSGPSAEAASRELGFARI